MMKQYKIFTFLMLLFVALGSSSCFDILEEYYFNKDGSGTATYTVDVKQMVSMLESFGEGLDSLGNTGESVDEMFEDTKAVTQLGKLPGIRNVKNLSDKDAGIVGYSYEFADMEALNNAIIATQENMDFAASMGLGGEEGGGETTADNSFSIKGKRFTRILELDTPDADDPEEGEEADKQYEEMAKMFFADHFYTIKYQFERRVKKAKKNEFTTKEDDGNTVTVKVPIMKLMEGEAKMSSQIKLK